MSHATHDSSLAPSLIAEIERADWLAQQGQEAMAAQAYDALLRKLPDYSRAHAFIAMRALRAGNSDDALHAIDRAVAGHPKLALHQAQRGQILAMRGDMAGQLQALEAALAIDPGFVPARFDAGRVLESMGRTREANAHYQEALSRLPDPNLLPPAMRERVAHAGASLRRESEELARFLQERLSGLPEGQDDDSRFQECHDIFLGKKKPMPAKPGMMHFPKLAPLTFYPRHHFEWLERLEAATDTIREEMLAMLASEEDRFIPYVQKNDAGEGSVWEPLNHKTDWGVFFLFNQGQRVERHLTACPRTAELLESLPLVRITGRGPTAFFSRLKPGTHIPAHHGATNTRLICHLPLVVPAGCRFRVGNDVREWKQGEMLIFDDTIEHEAWNDSDQDRVVLIFDVWNPFLTERERAQVTTMTEALAEFYPERLHDTDF